MQAVHTAADLPGGNTGKVSFSPEFRLVLACLRFPFAEEESATIREAAAAVADWQLVLDVCHRHRVFGLLLRGLVTAGVHPPADISTALQRAAGTQARQSMMLALETMRLGKAFREADLQAVFLKGAALTALAFGDASLRHAKDVDLWVPQSQVSAAVELLQASGYTPQNPNTLSADHQHVWLRYGKSIDWHRGVAGVSLELHWRLTDLPLLRGDLPPAALQEVAIAPGATVTTLGGDTLLAYLCVHGASHGWGRLKWLADVYTLLPHDNPAAVVAVYERLKHMDAGRSVGQAMLLCHDLLLLDIGPLQHELEKDATLQFLRRSALRLLAGEGETKEVDAQRFGSTSVYLSRFLLGRGAGALLSELRTWTYRPDEMAESRLPRSLFFLFPIVRVSSWFASRIRHGGRTAP
ncbi:nucleotidyltransferase domain-containing protein [Terriglobus roseus]|uniref:Uncharacterized nucleotidyltransferase n=1 Tax=Terriglobus roseus TaxID=392734 RepID=A0A1H4SA82_9BACT|nr:nucleotidyltransferase family protein [Terriglobus roseus]SEC40914.1 Uncharacterised nucleotidyltransferase [Terriglobus roseus]